MSVSQSSSSVMFDGSGQPDGERMVDQSGKSGVTFDMIGAHSNFSEDIQIERMVGRSGQPDERKSSKTQIRTLLEEQRQTIIAEYREKVGHHELQAAHAGEERRNFVKLVNKVLQKWKNYGNSRAPPSIRGSEHYFGINRQSTGIAK